MLQIKAELYCVNEFLNIHVYIINKSFNMVLLGMNLLTYGYK